MQGLWAQILLFRCCVSLHYCRYPRGWCLSICRSFTAKLLPFGSSQLYIQPEKKDQKDSQLLTTQRSWNVGVLRSEWQPLVGIRPEEKGVWCLLPISAWYYPKETETWQWGPEQRQPPPDDWLTLLQPTGRGFNAFKATFKVMLYGFLKQKIVSVQKHIFREDQRNNEKICNFFPLLLLQVWRPLRECQTQIHLI